MNSFRTRRILQYSMASLFLCIAIFGIWLGYVVNQGRCQHEAVRLLKGVGCDVAYSRAPATGTVAGTADTAYVSQPTWTSWLAERVGVDLVQRVVGLNLYDGVTDDDLEVLEKLPSIESLRLGTKISDEGLRHVSQLRELRLLTLQSCDVSSQGMAHLRLLSRLNDLEVSNTSVGDEGLKAPAGLPNLRHLDLGHSQISDDGLEHLVTFPRLTHLYLTGTVITNDGLTKIGRLGRLEILSLSYTQISDDGLAGLSGLNSLKSLSLKETKVTGRGLRHHSNTRLADLNLTSCELTSGAIDALAAISTLRSVYVTGDNLTNADVARLRKLRPKLAVTVVQDVKDFLGGGD